MSLIYNDKPILVQCDARIETSPILLIQDMKRGKFVAILTGAISILIAVAYLVLVQILDFRGEMIPAPMSELPSFHPKIELLENV